MGAIIGLVGHLAAGKGTAAKYMIERHGAAGARFSDSLREGLTIFDLPITRENMQDLSTILRQRFGENVLARAVARKARLMDAKLVAIDGVRRMTDIEGLGELPNFYLVALAVEQRIRFERCVVRGENEGDKTMTFEQFQERDTAEAEVQIPEVMQHARFTIDNSGTAEELYAKLDEIVAKVAA